MTLSPLRASSREVVKTPEGTGIEGNSVGTRSSGANLAFFLLGPDISTNFRLRKHKARPPSKILKQDLRERCSFL